MEEREQTGKIVRQEEYAYGSPDERNPGDGRSRFSGAALLLGIAGFFTVFFPYLTLPLGVMAILFGALGLRRGEPARGRAIVGIVMGSCLVLLPHNESLAIYIALLVVYLASLKAGFLQLCDSLFQRQASERRHRDLLCLLARAYCQVDLASHAAL